MKKKIILSFIMSILIFVFIGCGGDGTISYKEEVLKIRTISTLKGVIVDGYIVGASIGVEGANSNSFVSGENGEYSIDISYDSKRVKIQASGGIDKATGEPFEGILRTISLPNDVIYTTPLTTLVAFLVDDGESLENARIKVNSNLGFSDDLVLSKTDPFGDKLNNSVKIRLFKTTQQVQKVSEILKDSLGSDINYNDIAKVLAETISTNTGNKNSKDILNSNALIEGVLDKVINNKEKASTKLNAIKVALHQMVNTIESIGSIEYSKHIHLISSVYEKQSKSISDAVNNGDSTESLELDMKNLATTLGDISKVDSFMKAIKETPNSSLVDFLIKKVSESKGVIDISSETIQNEVIGKETPVKPVSTIKPVNLGGSGSGGSGSGGSGSGGSGSNKCSEYKGLTPPADDNCNNSVSNFPSFTD